MTIFTPHTLPPPAGAQQRVKRPLYPKHWPALVGPAAHCKRRMGLRGARSAGAVVSWRKVQ